MAVDDDGTDVRERGRGAALVIAGVAALSIGAWWALGGDPRGPCDDVSLASSASRPDDPTDPGARLPGLRAPAIDARRPPPDGAESVAADGMLAIRGHVRATDGTPVDGATVKASSTPTPGLEPRRATAESQADGTFVIDRLTPGTWSVQAEADRHASATAQVVDAGASGIELRLGRLGWIEGSVVTAEDRPFSGKLAFGNGDEWSFADADATGRFRSEPLAAATWSVEVATLDFVLERHEVVEVADGAPVRLTLRAVHAPRLVVRVVDEVGEEMGAKVVANLEERDTSGADFAVGEGYEMKWPELGGLAAGWWRVDVSVFGEPRATERLRLRPGEIAERTIRLPRPVSVAIHVVDAAGLGVAGARVRITRQGLDVGGVATTGPAGWTHVGLAPGFVRLEAHAPAAAAGPVDLEVTAVEGTEVTLVLVPERLPEPQRPGR